MSDDLKPKSAEAFDDADTFDERVTKYIERYRKAHPHLSEKELRIRAEIEAQYELDEHQLKDPKHLN